MLGALQENLITLLAYDPARAVIIRNTVDITLFGGPYRKIVTRIYDYIDRFKKPPADHLPDLFSEILEGPNAREATMVEEIIQSIHANKDTVNAEYITNQLETFIRRQSLRSIAVELAKELQRDTEQSLDKAETLIASAGKSSLSVFDPGTRLSDKSKALKFLDINDSAFPTGIKELDRRGFGPTRKEMWLGIGDTKAGKTWMLIQLAKMALIHRLKVVHITLEMSEDRAAQRYMQALFGIAKRREILRSTKFQVDDLGRITGFTDKKIKPSLTLDDPGIRRKLEKKIDKFSSRILDNIIVKQFPTGQLTLNQMQAYLDNLETTQQFVPDLIIVDYPDLMKLDADNFRLALDALYKGLRGVAVARNMALAVVSQGNREGSKAKQMGATNVAEAYSKIAHADCVITYSQSKSERALGLARLFVAAGRNDGDKFTVVISQQYGIGGFVVDSAIMRGAYADLVKDETTE